MSSDGRLFQRRASSVDHVTDLVDSVKQYAKQETIEPIKGAGRWLAYGSLASLCLGLSLVMATLAVLRLSQFVGGRAMSGSWSFVHYLVALVVDGGLVALTISRISRRTLEKN
jgi:hypothetical protein